MIGPNSRYATASIITTVGPNDDTRQEMKVPFPRSKIVTYTYHRVVDGQRIDVIANEYYGDGRLWWVIADANPEVFDWLDLEAGQIIRVPRG